MPFVPEALARLIPARLRASHLIALGDSPSSSRPPSAEQKGSRTGALVAFEQLGEPVWSPRDYGAFAREGFMQNAILYRSVRMIAEAAASIPLLLYEGDEEVEDHPLIELLRRPSLDHTSVDFFESWYGFLLVAGNAYVEAVAIDGEVRELHVLRPDRMKVIPGPDGWPEGYEYTAGGQSIRFVDDVVPGVRPILHTRLFHPANDHYGFSPVEAASVAIDIHNEASKWNKALLDNSARPSGALVYAAANGQMTGEQFERLKQELETSYQGARHAGRPLLLEGGLDWKPLSLSPKDMDFIAAKNSAAREIALALGVPPMLLGIPGDNTFANFAEAQKSLWRNTVLPLVNRTCRAFTLWLAHCDSPSSIPASAGRPQGAERRCQLELRPDLDQVEALTPERERLWSRLNAAKFLTEDEKRAAAGYGAKDAKEELQKYRPDQPRVPAGNSDGGQWTEEGGVSAGTSSDTIAGGSGKDKIAATSSENPRARIGGNRPPLQSGTFIGKAGSVAGRFVFGPVGALIAAIVSSDPLNNDQVPGNESGGTGDGASEIIPPYSGGKSEGVLETTEGDFYLKSGWAGPARSVPRGASGFDIVTLTHVEGHAVALMRQLGLKEARVYINKPELCISCIQNLPRMLAPGSKLEVVTPLGSKTFAGSILP